MAAVGGDDQYFGFIFLGGVGMPFGIAGWEATFGRLNPDLQQAGRLGFGWIELAVVHSAAGAHQLDLSGFQHPSISHAVLVFECSVKDVAKDFHVVMRMRRESGAWSDDILINDPQ